MASSVDDGGDACSLRGAQSSKVDLRAVDPLFAVVGLGHAGKDVISVDLPAPFSPGRV